jgi:hypothetical protein
LTTNISVVDDYTAANSVPPVPVIGIYNLFQPPVESAPVAATVEPEPVDPEAEAEVEAKVVKSPGKAAPKPKPASEAVETK